MKRGKWFQLVSLCILLILSFTFIPMDTGWMQAGSEQSSVGQLYYYYEGQRLPLTIAPEVIAVRFRSSDTIAQTDAIQRSIPTFQVTQIDQHTKPSYTLLHLDDQTTIQRSMDAVNQLRQNKAAVEWANPVFRAPGGYAVMTDEFIAQFPASWTHSQIQDFNIGN